MIGNDHAIAWINSRAVVSRIVKDVLDFDDQILISQAHRRMRNEFSINNEIKQINEKYLIEHKV